MSLTRSTAPAFTIAVAMYAATVASAQSPGNLRRFSSCDLGISFIYPADWGNPVVTDHRDDPDKAYLLHAAGMDWELRFESLHYRPFMIVLRVDVAPADSDVRTVTYEGWNEKTTIGELRYQVEHEASTTIAGNPALVVDSYFDPGGGAQRKVTWFCDHCMVELTIEINVGDFANVKYDKLPLGVSRLLELNPDDVRLRSFVDAVQSLLNEFRCES